MLDTVGESLDELAEILKGDKTFAMRGELFQRVDHRLFDICQYLYDLEQVAGEGELCWPKTKNEIQQLSTMNAAIVPLASHSNDFLDDFVKWTTLYSELSIFVLPITIETMDISYSHQGTYERDTWPDLETLIEYNRRYRHLIKARQAIFLPRETKYTFTSLRDYEVNKYTAPLIQRPDKYVFTPLNAKKHMFTGKSYQDFLIYKEILIPYFRIPDIDDLIKIAKNETESFQKFNHYLTRRLVDISRVQSTKELQSILSEIDYEIANVEIEIKKLSRLKALQGVEVAFLAVSLSILVLTDIDFAKQIAGIAGSVNLLELLREVVSYQREKIDVKKSDFYLPYLLKKTGKA